MHRLLAIACALTGSVHAATYTVTSIADAAGTCPDAANCTLRTAIMNANALGGTNTIAFGIAGSGVHTIAIASALPAITGTLTIDGYTQPGSATNTLTPDAGALDTVLAVEVSGGTSNFTGFQLAANANLTVQGLALNHFNIAINGNGGGPDASHLYVYGNFIGTTIDGTAFGAAGNGDCAVRTGFTTAQIGGTQPWQRNLLSGNGCGVMVGGPATIQGNLIGTDASGTLAIPNGLAGNWPGIYVSTRANVHIGGASAAARNVISGNRPWGIGLWDIYAGAISNFEIKGNYIGTDWSGTKPLPNGYAEPANARYGGAIQIENSGGTSGYPIGGFGVGEANLIAFNTGSGFNSINYASGFFDNQGNVIHDNRGVGFVNIDVGAAGPSANDAGDADSGAQNYPEVLTAAQNGDQLTVTYRVDTAPANAAYPLRIDFYQNVHGGSGALIAQDSYALADAQGERTVTLTLAPGVQAIPFVISATDAAGHSSELAPAYDVIFEDAFE